MPESLSIVIPAYNEAARITDSLARIVEFASAWPAPTEIIVVDDGSTDATASLVSDAAAELRDRPPGRCPPLRLIRHERNRGKGAATRIGFENAHHDIVLLTDADLSTPISEAPRIIAPIATGECDVTIGSRALDLSKIETQQSLFRRSAGRVFNRLVRLATGLEFRDTQCGFKAFRRQTIASAFARQRIEGFAFDVEILYLASKLGLRIRELPVRWAHAEGSKVHMLHHPRQMAFDLCRIALNDRRGRYDFGR